MPDTQTSTHLTQIGTVIVGVSDQDAALAFYTEKLGLETRNDIPFGDGNRWIEVAPEGTTTTIALMPPREGSDDPVGTETGIALNTDDIDAAHAELRDRGVDVDAEVSRMGGPVPPMFWLRDQDGNSLFVVETQS
jgi:catechol 2,3-dioxygenase-like lactoylglutathione lyase family enzyme